MYFDKKPAKVGIAPPETGGVYARLVQNGWKGGIV